MSSAQALDGILEAVVLVSDCMKSQRAKDNPSLRQSYADELDGITKVVRQFTKSGLLSAEHGVVAGGALLLAYNAGKEGN